MRAFVCCGGRSLFYCFFFFFSHSSPKRRSEKTTPPMGKQFFLAEHAHIHFRGRNTCVRARATYVWPLWLLIQWWRKWRRTKYFPPIFLWCNCVYVLLQTCWRCDRNKEIESVSWSRQTASPFYHFFFFFDFLFIVRFLVVRNKIDKPHGTRR